jgi:DNA replication protein DnaC
MGFGISKDQLERLRRKYIDPCSICGGERYLLTCENKNTKVQRCECLKQFNKIVAYTKANLPESFFELELDLPPEFEENNKESLEVVKSYIDNLDKMLELGMGLYLYGADKCGKTFIGVDVLKKVLRKRHTAYFISARELLGEMMLHRFDIEFLEKVNEIVENVDFLMIDDVNTLITAYSKDLGVISDIFRNRFYSQKPIIITSSGRAEDVEIPFEDGYYRTVVDEKTYRLLLRGKYVKPV